MVEDNHWEEPGSTTLRGQRVAPQLKAGALNRLDRF